MIALRVLHTVAGLNERFGGPSRTVPALCDSIAAKIEWIGLASQRFKWLSSPVIVPSDPRVETIFFDAIYSDHLRVAVSWRGQRSIGRVIRSRGVRLVHDHGVWQWFNHSAAGAARSEGIPRVVSPRGMLMQWPMSRSTTRKRILLELFQRRDLEDATGLVATSKEEAADMRALGFAQPIAVIPNGVFVEGQRGTRPTSDRRRMVFLSRVHPKKGLANLLQAWARLHPAEWRLVIAGPDELGHRAELESLATRLRMGDSVEFAGPVAEPDKSRFLTAAEVVVLPSESENFGMVVAEALALGIPVIASTGTPWREIAICECGWWIPNNVESLVEALREATDKTSAELIAMGDRGRELANQYSWRAVGAQTVAFYRWILGEGEQPSFATMPGKRAQVA